MGPRCDHCLSSASRVSVPAQSAACCCSLNRCASACEVVLTDVANFAVVRPLLQPKPKPKKKADKKPVEVASEVLADPVAEKLRQQRCV